MKFNYQMTALRKTIKEKGLFYGNIDLLKTHEGMEELLSGVRLPRGEKEDEENRETKDIHSFTSIKEKFPEEVMFFTTDELGIMAFNRLENKAYFVSVSGKPLTLDGNKMKPAGIFSHDLLHIILSQANYYSGRKVLQKMLERIDNMSKSDREKAELALFTFHHELGSIHVIWVLEKYYKGAKANLSLSEQRQFIVDIKEYVRIMMTNESVMMRRFLEPHDLQTLLPESVNVNNRQEVERYLIESADIFADIFSGALLTVGNFDQAL